MNTNEKIFKALNEHVKHVEIENTFTPKVQSTVYPDKVLNYNEIHENINKQLKLKHEL